jgi:hypothetical protein
MKTLVFSGLIIASTWIWAYSPSPRPSVEGNRKADEIANNTQHNQGSPTATPSPVPTDSANGNENNTGGPKADNCKSSDCVHPVQPLAISTVPDKPLGVSTVKDHWDKALVIATVALVLVGAFGIKYAVKTLSAIDKQAVAMDGQLKEMKAARALTRKQVQYIVNTERAWVMGELGWFEKKGANVVENTSKGRESTTIVVKLTCRNEGKSPAWIDQVYSHLDIVDGGSIEDEREIDDSFRPTELGQNGPMGALGARRIRSRGVILTCLGRRKESEFFSAYVIVEYRDIFGTKRETILGYSIDSNGNIDRQDALPNRNRNT